MSSMSYCQFQNLLKGLRNCVANLEDKDYDLSSTSEEEKRAAKRFFDETADLYQELKNELGMD